MKNKLIGIGIAVLIVAVCYVVDYLISLTYAFEILDIDPNPTYSDGATETTIKVRLTKKGTNTPVEGHDLYALSLDGGTWKAYRQRTDANGEVTFTFIPFLSTSIRPNQDIRIRIRDESNSIFLAVCAKYTFVLDVDEPEGTNEDAMTSASFFG